MESESPQSGFEELMRQQQAEQRQKVQDVLGGLKELKLSVAIEQLRLVAPPEIIEQVSSLQNKPGTGALRALISQLADDLENRISTIATAHAEMKPVEKSVKTLTILMELFFSLQ